LWPESACREEEELPAMLPFLAFASVSGAVTNAGALQARADLPHLGVRAPSLSRATTVRRSPVMCLTPTGRTWNDIVKRGFSRTATPEEFCRRIQRAGLTETEEAAYVLYNAAWCGGFCREAYAELYRRGFTEDPSFSRIGLHCFNMDLRTDPVALALFDEKGTEWCSNSGVYSPMTLEVMAKQAVPARFADFVEIETCDDDEKEHVWVNFDKAFRCGIFKILDNGGSAMDDDARAWRAIVSSYEKAWPDCGISMSVPLAGFDFQQDDFWQYSVPTLRSKLRDAGITGFSKTNKPELVAQLRLHYYGH
jgi:hypothetical protein